MKKQELVTLTRIHNWLNNKMITVINMLNKYTIKLV